MSNQFDAAIEITNNYIPNIKVKYKDDSLLMKIIGKLLFFNKEFLTRYTTTIGDTVYFPSENFINIHPISCIAIFLHECVHISDSRKNIFFKFLYLMPQILILLMPIVMFFNIYLGLACLLFLLPLPAYFRMNYEFRAYAVSLYVNYRICQIMKCKYNIYGQKNQYLENFLNSNYYFMFPFKDYLYNRFDKIIVNILNNELPYDEEITQNINKILIDLEKTLAK